jgi:hypothetical protein
MQTRFFLYIYFGLSILTLVTLISPSAKAQYWLEDRTRAEGHGIRLGDLELHPGIGAEMGYDSNVFYRAKGVEDSPILRISPHLLLSTLSQERRFTTDTEGEKRTPPAVNFKGGINAGYYHYFSIDDAVDNVSLGLDFHLNINPERPFSLLLDANFTRNVNPFVQYVGIKAPSYARDDLLAGPKLVFSSRSGLLMGAVGYRFGASLFEASAFNFYNNITHFITLDGNWQFFPRTALVYDASLGLQNYTKDVTDESRLQLNDNRRVASRLGINGALTTTIALTARAGYAAGFFDGPYEDYDGVIGGLELRWKPADAFAWKLGYERSYTSSYEGNYGRQDRIYTNAGLMIGRVFLLDAEVWAGLLQYGVPRRGDGQILGTTPGKREDTRVGASIGGEYRFVSWLGVNAKVGYMADYTDFETDLSNLVSPEPAKFKKFDAWLGIRAFY